MEDLTNLLIETSTEEGLRSLQPEYWTDETAEYEQNKIEDKEQKPGKRMHRRTLPYDMRADTYTLPPGVTLEEMQTIINRVYGEGRSPHSERTRLAISIACMGLKKDESTKQKISQTLAGRPHTEDHKQRISESLRGKKRRPMSEETKRKISESRKRRTEI